MGDRTPREMTVRNFSVSTEPGVQAGLTDTRQRAHRALTLVVAILLASCSSPPPPPPPAPIPAEPAAAVPPPPPPAPSRWEIVAPTTSVGFVIESRATFSTRADTLSRSDTSVSRTALRVTPRGAAIDVTVGAYSIVSSYSQPLALTAASRAVGRFDALGGIAFEGPGESSCTSLTSTAFESTRDLWVKWPPDVVIGTQWRDSTVIQSCRDGVPFRVSLMRSYRVTAVDTSTRLVVVDRTSQAAISGQGVLRGDTITLAGGGTGTARLRVEATTGWMYDAAGSSTLQLRAMSRARTQTVDQRVEFTARRDSTSR
jgi:hypothetical protein